MSAKKQKLNWQFYDQELSKDLKEDWKSLSVQSTDSCASSFPIFTANSRSFLIDKNLLYAFAFNDKELVCVIPLAKKTKWIFLIPARILHFINHDHLDIYTIAKMTDWCTSDILDSFFSALKSQVADWDYFQGKKLLCHTTLSKNYLHPYYSKKVAYFNITNAVSISDLVSSKLLRNLNRHQRKLSSLGNFLHLHEAKERDQVIDALEIFFEIEDSGWKGIKKSSIKASKGTLDFYSDTWQVFANSNHARVFLLYLDHKPVAGSIAFEHCQTLYLHKIAYLHEFAQYSPGSILIKCILDNCLTNKSISKVCFNTYPEWIKRWHPKSHSLRTAEYFNTNIPGYAIKVIIGIRRMLRRAKKILSQ